MAAAPLYQAYNGAQLLRRRLDVVEAVYHRPSAITHILTDPAPAILDALIEIGPANPAQLRERLEREYSLQPSRSEAEQAREMDEDHRDHAENIDDNDRIMAIICARLEELVDIGLIEKLPNRAATETDDAA